VQRVMFASIGLIAALAAYVAIVGYALPELSFTSTKGVKSPVTLDNLFIWVLGIASLVLAIRFLLYAVRPPGTKSNRRTNS
jgi:hypothetical protein